MFKAILFDLDGTLLNIKMEVFLKYYFMEMMKLAAKAGFKDVKGLADQVFSSTDIMISDRSPDICNEDVFMKDFFNHCDYPEKETRAFFDRFYSEGFPRLHKYCSSFEGMPEMMDDVFKKGFKVVIATNAVFPMSALQQRIAWAGVGNHSYDLITSYEHMHFCKPHPEYYMEIAEKIGVEPRECLMVGNDVGEDLVAGVTGMKTFLLEDMLIDKKKAPYKPDWRGNLNDLYSFVKKL